MNFDRNTIIGFVILALLFFGFFYYNNQQQMSARLEKMKQDSITRAQDSIKRIKEPQAPVTVVKTDTLPDSIKLASDTGVFRQTAAMTEQVDTLENDLLRIYFTNKGGQPKKVELKKFKGTDSNLVRLAATDFDKISYTIINPATKKTTEIASQYFSRGEKKTNADGSRSILFKSPDGKSILHEFVIRPNNYMLDFNLSINGVDQLLSNNTLFFTWQNRAVKQQKDLKYEREQSQISYREDGDYDYSSATSSSSEEFSKPVNWLAVKQQFFNTTLVAKNNFSGGTVTWKAPQEGDHQIVVEATANMRIQLANAPNATIPFSIFYGPTDYKTLKKYGNDMEDMVNLGTGIFAFVKYINRWIVIPIFDFFSKLISNFGIVILLLTLFIRLLISPLTYSSYLSGAKMKVLRPEIEQLKVKYGNDQQQISMEQMKLFREAGVNPLGGCIPALLQIPIFFALYSFFNSNVALRGQNFLWADDLSQYDSVLDFGFNIPLYGDHVSLFTITAVVTSFLISIYSMSMTPDQSNPVLKYMPYFFPVILLFVFNNLPSGLTWYYTVSNLITLILQFVIQNYIINHDKILAKIEANRKKPKTKSKWAERMEQMQQQQKQLKETQNKGRR